MFTPTSSTSIQNEILDAYMKSLGAGAEHRFRNELQIFGITGQISSYFVHGQELDNFAVNELCEVVKEWEIVDKGLFGAQRFKDEAMSLELLSRFDNFRTIGRFDFWTQMTLEDLRASLADEKAIQKEMRRG